MCFSFLFENLFLTASFFCIYIWNIWNTADLSWSFITCRAFTVSGKVRPEEAVQATLSSLPDEVVDTVGITALPSEDSVSERRRKLEYLEMQEELIKVDNILYIVLAGFTFSPIGSGTYFLERIFQFSIGRKTLLPFILSYFSINFQSG